METPEQSGFRIHNPKTQWTDPKAIAGHREIARRAYQSGSWRTTGQVTLLDVKDDIAYVALGGGRQGCGMADVTLKQGIQALITEEVPGGIRQVVDSTDHASGTNPFYQPAEGGESPFV